MRILTARWVFPVASPPIPSGAVAVEAGAIVEVGPARAVTAARPEAECWDLGEAALLPGLVNCHTHLELASLPRPVGEAGFVPWVVALVEGRREITPEAREAIAGSGAGALLACGTTSVGDVSTAGQSIPALRRLGLRGVVYREILGLHPDAAEHRLRAAQEDLRAMQAQAAEGRLRIGLSPHSPYGLSELLFRGCDSLLLQTGMPVCIHAAESPEEVEFLATGGGAIPGRLYPAVGCPDPPPRRRARSPAAYLEMVGALAWRPLLVHAVHVDAEDILLMVRRGVSVAHCPRSNLRLSGATAPVPACLARGLPVGLGTDSLASAPSLDLWDEMRAALALHAGSLTAADILSLGTLRGARALGLGAQVGSLEPGKRADLVAVSAAGVTAADPERSLLETTRGDNVLLILIDGEVRHRRLEGRACH